MCRLKKFKICRDIYRPVHKEQVALGSALTGTRLTTFCPSKSTCMLELKEPGYAASITAECARGK
jgi:hypothetical protein